MRCVWIRLMVLRTVNLLGVVNAAVRTQNEEKHVKPRHQQYCCHIVMRNSEFRLVHF